MFLNLGNSLDKLRRYSPIQNSWCCSTTVDPMVVTPVQQVQCVIANFWISMQFRVTIESNQWVEIEQWGEIEQWVEVINGFPMGGSIAVDAIDDLQSNEDQANGWKCEWMSKWAYLLTFIYVQTNI